MTKKQATDKLVAWLMSQVGYEADNKWNKYAAELDKTNWYNGKKNGYDWCCVFADFGFYHVFGYDNAKKMEFQPEKSLGAACYYAARYFKEHDAYYKTPEVGDRIFYGEDGDDHTGIVVAVNATTIETVEGNVSDSVVHEVRNKNDSWIDGYGRPDWSVVAESGLLPPDYEADPDRVWDYLADWLGNDFGAAGLMGNLEAESGLVSAIVQYGSGWTAKEYTEAVDDGTYKDFSEDGNGYGIAQWTYHTRKEKLLRHCKAMSASVGNLEAQLGYLKKEIEAEFPSVWSTLKKAKSVAEASDAVLLWYERPADQSEANLARRRARGQKFYDKYHGHEPEPHGGYCEVTLRIIGIGDTGNDVAALQGCLFANGYDLEYCGGCDGIFGEGTEYAVKSYQREKGLDVDGVVGEDTWGALLSD